MMKKLFSLLMMALLTVAAWAGTVEFDLTTGFTNQQEVSTVTKDGVTLTFDKGTNSNAPKWYSNGSAVRLYGGSTLTVTAAGISQVEFTFNGDSNLSANVGSYSNGIWTGAADGIVFTQGGTSGHVKIQKVVVTFAGDPDALYAPNVLLNGEAPKPQYTVDDLPLYLTLVSNNGTEYPIGQYSLLEDPDNGELSAIAESFELELGDNEALNLKYGTNKLSVREVLDWLGENEAITDWGSITFTVKEQPPVISSVAEFNGVADNFELTFGEDLTVVAQFESYLYAQDAEKGMLIYGSGVPTYNHGDIIPAGFTGKKTTYKGAPEMINPDGLQEATQNVSVIPIEITPAEATLGNFGRYAAIRSATIDGTTITASGETVTLYNRFGVDVPSTGTVFDIYGVVGYYNGPQFLPLEYVDKSPLPPLAVTISPVPTEGQTFTEPVQVTITCNRANAQVSYEIDGHMQAYTGPFTIYESATVRAIANADNGAIAEATQTYTINLPDIAVSFTPAAGIYPTAQNVKLNITNAFGEVSVRYTLNDGAQWSEYTDAGIDVTESATLKVAVADVRNTIQEFTAEYVINQPIEMTVAGLKFNMVKVEGNDDIATFYIGECEVTEALWLAVMGGENPSSHGGSLNDNLPVENITWNDCQAFVAKLNRMTGYTFRLPTIAEWLFAARGGNYTHGYTYSGSNTIGDVAWYASNCEQKQPVGTKAANELGLRDMSGSVYEIIQEATGAYGGGWHSPANHCKANYWWSTDQTFKDDDTGFRLALTNLDVNPILLRGDLNGDGTVDVADLNICINIILELNNDPAAKALADLDGDGSIDISDVNALINIILTN